MSAAQIGIKTRRRLRGLYGESLLRTGHLLVANAVFNAIGVRIRTLPITPAAVLMALGRLPQRS